MSKYPMWVDRIRRVDTGSATKMKSLRNLALIYHQSYKDYLKYEVIDQVSFNSWLSMSWGVHFSAAANYNRLLLLAVGIVN